jgi:hypothetical protein
MFLQYVGTLPPSDTASDAKSRVEMRLLLAALPRERDSSVLALIERRGKVRVGLLGQVERADVQVTAAEEEALSYLDSAPH